MVFVFTTKGRVLTGVCIFGGIIFLFYLLFYLPHIKYIKSLERQIKYENIKVMQLKKKTEQLNELQIKHKKIQAKLSFLMDNLQKNHSNFLYQLGLRGRIYKINYLEITPQSTIKEKYYYRTPIKIHLYGTYHSLGMLLSDMAKNQAPGSFTVDTVLIKAVKNKKYTIEAYLIISLYKYKTFNFAENSAGTPKIKKTNKTSQTILRRKR